HNVERGRTSFPLSPRNNENPLFYLVRTGSEPFDCRSSQLRVLRVGPGLGRVGSGDQGKQDRRRELQEPMSDNASAVGFSARSRNQTSRGKILACSYSRSTLDPCCQ
ncbi:hypothetical protein Droror1_Dr00000923, partial [Drosera rotundifolia]